MKRYVKCGYEIEDYDEWYETSKGIAESIRFGRRLEALVRKNYDIADYTEDLSSHGSRGYDYVDFKLTDGTKYSFEFPWEDQKVDIFVDGPTKAANYYFEKIKDGVESGDARVD